jgi:hypothetical protein
MSKWNLTAVAAAALAVVGAAAAVFADENTFLISSTLDKLNTNPCLAVDPVKKNVLVVWSQDDKDDTEYGVIYAAFGKRKAGGVYKFNKPFAVSSSEGRNGEPCVVFDPVKPAFFVLWDNRDLEEYAHVHVTKFFGRFVSRMGKVSGPIFTVLDQKEDDGAPGLCLFDGAAAPAAGPTYLLLWNHYPMNWSEREETGLYSALLDAGGRMVSQPQRLLQGKWQDDTGGSTKLLWYFGFSPDKIIRSPGGQYFMAICSQVLPPVSDYYHDIHLLKIDNTGSLVKSVRIDTNSAYSGRMALVAPDLFFASWYKENNTVEWYVNRLYRGDLKPKGAPFSPLADGSVIYSDVVKLGKNKGSYQLSSTYTPEASAPAEENILYGRYITKKGKLSGEPRLILNHEGYLHGFTAAPIPGKNDVFIAWKRWVNDKKTEIWGICFSAK